MIRARDLALRAALADAPIDATCAAFEAVMLVRVAAGPADPNRAAWARPSTLARRADAPTPGILAEFDTLAAAERLVADVAYIAPLASVESADRGCRHRYEIHRVAVPVDVEPMVRAALRRAGRSGSAAICAPASSRPDTVRARRHHRALAAAAWRAALLAAGPGRGADRLGIRIGDPDATCVLVRAAAVLDVPIRTVLRPGGHLISVAGNDAITMLFEQVTIGAAMPVGAAPQESLAG